MVATFPLCAYLVSKSSDPYQISISIGVTHIHSPSTRFVVTLDGAEKSYKPTTEGRCVY